MNEFSDRLLMTIGSWQNGWREDQSLRLKIGTQLKHQSRCLDSRFKRVGEVCYRKRFIHSTELEQFFLRELIEGPASWTIDPQFAQTFKGIEKENAIMGAIFQRSPSPDEVVLNINALWQDIEFQETAMRYIEQKKGYWEALDHFRGTQGEIILHSRLLPEDIYAISGRSDDFDVLCSQAGVVEEVEKDRIWKVLVESNIHVGDPTWINRKRALRVLSKSMDAISDLLKPKKSTLGN